MCPPCCPIALLPSDKLLSYPSDPSASPGFELLLSLQARFLEITSANTLLTHQTARPVQHGPALANPLAGNKILLIIWAWGRAWQCLGLTSGSVLRDLTWVSGMQGKCLHPCPVSGPVAKAEPFPYVTVQLRPLLPHLQGFRTCFSPASLSLCCLAYAYPISRTLFQSLHRESSSFQS